MSAGLVRIPHSFNASQIRYLMLPRIIVPLLAAAALVFACGPRAPKSVANARPRTGIEKGVTSHVMVDGQLQTMT